MKEIEFPCPRCGKQMKAPVEYAGRQVNCISCKQKVLIPANLHPYRMPKYRVTFHRRPGTNSNPNKTSISCAQAGNCCTREW